MPSKILFFCLSFFFLSEPVLAQATRGGGGGDRPDSVTPVRCKEGKLYMLTEQDRNGNSQTVFRPCHDGRLYPKKEVKIIRCRDGEGTLFLEPDLHGNLTRQVWKVCRDGVYKE